MEKTIYRLDDKISFRKCDLFDDDKLSHGDCTNFDTKEKNWKTYYCCNNYGIHLHCTTHPEIELNTWFDEEYGEMYLGCPKCKEPIEMVENYKQTINRCLRMLNIEEFKNAKLVRLDDWYVPEIKEKEKIESGYWINTQVKTDRDGDTIIVVYVGHKGTNEKAQFFIKPEKLQLSNDHKDLDPAKILTKIEVTFKNKKVIQEFDEI